MKIEVTGRGNDRVVVADGVRVDEQLAYRHAKTDQGYTGTFAEWLDLSAEEREGYELGAAGIGN